MINDLPRKTLNVDRSNLLPLYTLKEHDDVILKLALFKNSVSFDITGQTIRLGAKTSAGLKEQNEGFTIDKSNLDIVLKNSILSRGLVELDLQFIDANGQMTTASFFISVGAKVLNDNAVEASNEFDTFKKTVEEIQGDYQGLRTIMIDENNAANLQDQVNQVTASLEMITNIDFNKDVVLYTAFNGINGTELDLYLSNDGYNLEPINFNSIFRYDDETPSRDFSIVKYNGYYYLTYGTQVNDKQVIGLARTKDFLNFEKWYYDLNREYPAVYAPQFYKENDNIYVVVSLQVSNNVISGHLDMRMYYIRATNSDLTTFSQPVLINFIDETQIDASIHLVENKIYAFSKREDTGEIKQYIGDTLSIETTTWTYLRKIDFGTGLSDSLAEGISLVKINGTYFLYADKFGMAKTAVVTSSDLNTWSTPKLVNNKYNLRTKHFDCMLLDNEDKRVISNFINRNSIQGSFDLWFRTNYPYYPNVLKLNDYITNNVFEPPTNLKGKTIFYSYGDVTIDFIKMDRYDNNFYVGKNHYDLNNIELYVTKGSKLTLKHKINDGNLLLDHHHFTLPNSKDLVISDANGQTEVIFELKKLNPTERNYRVVGLPNYTNQRKKSFDTGATNSISFKAYVYNGVSQVIGHTNNITTQDKIINSCIGFLNNSSNLINNTGFYQGLTMTYTANSFTYDITISGFPVYSIVDVILNDERSYFID